MTTVVFAGAGFGLGLAMFVLGLVPQRRTLLSVLAELDAGRSAASADSVPLLASSRIGRRLERLELVAGQRIAYELLARGWLGASSLRTDMALLGYDPARYMASKVAWALAAFASVPLLALVFSLLGLPGIFSLWVGLLWAALVFVLPDMQVRKLAARRRRDFRTVVGTYLDLVAMRVASGSGVAEGLTDAATIGEGWTFARIRAALSGGRTDGLSPARSLGRLGSELDVPELIDLASQLSLVDTAGAQAETSLRAKAASLRERQLSDAHGKANERSQHMLIAQVLLGVGFLILIGYPAVSKVLLL
ncbi:MAG TPA: type II secretion system protein [Actinomycetes bacterium]|nr:type II secretion system protein [Actinomycetes bacterium]